MICKIQKSSGISLSDNKLKPVWSKPHKVWAYNLLWKAALHICLAWFFQQQIIKIKCWICFMQKMDASNWRKEHRATSLPVHFMPLQQELLGDNWTKFVGFWDPSNCGNRSAWTNVFSRAYQSWPPALSNVLFFFFFLIRIHVLLWALHSFFFPSLYYISMASYCPAF